MKVLPSDKKQGFPFRDVLRTQLAALSEVPEVILTEVGELTRNDILTFTGQALSVAEDVQFANFSEMVAVNRQCDGHWKQLAATEKRP